MNRVINKRLSILDTALSMVRQLGFESVSISTLANAVGMSKSGLFAHFNSKEKMHLMILDHAAYTFSEEVFRKSLTSKRGLPRLKKIIKNWIDWYKAGDGGTCPFLAAAVEYDSKPGPVKNRIQNHTNALIKSLIFATTLCVEEGEFQENTDTKKFAYELYSLVIGHLVYLRTMESKSATTLFNQSINDLIARHQA